MTLFINELDFIIIIKCESTFNVSFFYVFFVYSVFAVTFIQQMSTFCLHMKHINEVNSKNLKFHKNANLRFMLFHYIHSKC